MPRTWFGRVLLGTDDDDKYERILAERERRTLEAQTDKRLEQEKVKQLESDLGRKANEMARKEEKIGKTVAELHNKTEELCRVKSEMQDVHEKSKLKIQKANDRVMDAKQKAESIKDELLESERKGKAEVINLLQKGSDERVQAEREKRVMERDHQMKLQEGKDAEMKIQEKMFERMITMQQQNNQQLATLMSTVVENQTKQIQSLSDGMKSIGEGLNQLKITDGRDGAAGETCRVEPSIPLKNFCLEIIDNFGAYDSARRSVTRDQAKLKKLFKSFEIEAKQIRKSENLELVSEECAEEDYSSNDGIVVFLFAPGNNMVLQDGPQTITVEEFWEGFARNESLRTKPKILFVNVIGRTSGATPSTEDEPSDENLLMCYCEMPEELYLGSKNGSLFVNALCGAMGNPEGTDIAKILEKVEDEVLQNNPEEVNFKILKNLTIKVKVAKEDT